MAESQPLLGSKSLTVHERNQHRPLHPSIEDTYQQGSTQGGIHRGGDGPRYQQGCSKPQQLGGKVPGQPPSSALSTQPQPVPLHQETSSNQPRGRANVLPPPSLNEDQAREALLLYISNTCCWSAGPAYRMVIKDIVPSSRFCYKLETFTEKRVMRNVSEPYKGQPITLLPSGTAPGPWDVSVNPTSLFKNNQVEVEIPNTVSIRSCPECYGKGFIKCNTCNGNGGGECMMCNGGRNRRDNRDCFSCKGSGRSCHDCHGNGKKKCPSCVGTAQMKTFTEITVTRTNHTDIASDEATGIPRRLMGRATGRVAFEEELPRVNPITHFQEEAINNASGRLIAKHNRVSQFEKIIRQRHSVKLIPVSEVRCRYQGRPIRYFVYGFDNKVYAPDYPAQCCCTIL